MTGGLPRHCSNSESVRATVGDVSGSLRDYAEGINASPERLAEIEDRLAALDRLKRKYGKTVAEVIEFGEEVVRRLAEVEDKDEILKVLRADLDEAAEVYRAAAGAVHPQRKAAAGKLAKLAEGQMNSLAMKVKFAVEVLVRQMSRCRGNCGWRGRRRGGPGRRWITCSCDQSRRAAEGAG